MREGAGSILLVVLLAAAALSLARLVSPQPRIGPREPAPPCADPIERAGEGILCQGATGLLRPGDVVAGEGPAGRMASSRLELLAVRLDLNRASLDELESLPGIGPRMAARIARGRPYAKVEDLLAVPGMGRRRLERLRPRLLVADEALAERAPPG